ncbi:MAG: hypothetical protein ACJAWS_002192 [Oleiphilaceae bacterium]|jgi:hypothetical protein
MRRTLFAILIILPALFTSSSLFAEEAALPVEPQIVIRQEDDKTIYQHSVNGVITEIKIVPEIGATYYLVPDDGGGWIREDRSETLIPKWVLFEW